MPVSLSLLYMRHSLELEFHFEFHFVRGKGVHLTGIILSLSSISICRCHAIFLWFVLFRPVLFSFPVDYF